MERELNCGALSKILVSRANNIRESLSVKRWLHRYIASQCKGTFVGGCQWLAKGYLYHEITKLLSLLSASSLHLQLHC